MSGEEGERQKDFKKHFHPPYTLSLSALLLFSPSVMSDSAHQQKLCPRTLAPALCTWLRVDSPGVAVTVKPDLGSTVPATARDARDVGSTPGLEDPLEEGHLSVASVFSSAK